MNSIIAAIKRRPVLTYYALTFTISWGGVLLAVGGPGGIPAATDQFEKQLPLVTLALLGGPSISSLLLTGLVSGIAGYRDLLSRLRRWRVEARWYTIALVTAPLAMLAVPSALSLFFPDFRPGLVTTDQRTTLLMIAVVSGVIGGIFEELGWTGYAIPRLRVRHSLLTTGLIVGYLWGAWHLLINLWSSGTQTGSFSLALVLHTVLFSVTILPAFRILMIWTYDRTDSLFVAIAMHTSLIASNVLLVPSLDTGMPLAVWSVIVGASLWLVVAAVALANRGQLWRPGKPTVVSKHMQQAPQ
jgi:uncharacterized protein